MTPRHFEMLLRRARRHGVTVVLHDDPTVRSRWSCEDRSLFLYQGLPLLERFRLVHEALEALAVEEPSQLHAEFPSGAAPAHRTTPTLMAHEVPSAEPDTPPALPPLGMLGADRCELCAGARYALVLGIALCRHHQHKAVMTKLSPGEVQLLRRWHGAHPEVGFEIYDAQGRARALLPEPSASRVMGPRQLRGASSREDADRDNAGGREPQ